MTFLWKIVRVLDFDRTDAFRDTKRFVTNDRLLELKWWEQLMDGQNLKLTDCARPKDQTDTNPMLQVEQFPGSKTSYITSIYS